VIADFEARLAEVLGGRMAAPFTGRVNVEPGTAAEPELVIGVRLAELVAPAMGEHQDAVVPGAAAPRRVVRARCTVEVRAVATTAGGRAQSMAALDAAIFALDAADFRDGSALATTTGDPGFQILAMQLAQVLAPQRPDDATAPLIVRLAADGLFWPRGTTGQAGRAIASIVVRGVVLPIELDPRDPQATAGGDPIAITIAVRLPVGSSLPFGTLAVGLAAPGGRPGAGSLSGGTAGTGGVRLLTLVDGAAEVTYHPPATAALDLLVVGLDDSAGGAGLELTRFAIGVRA
jgi:hypothetical protein